ncbi:MAG: flavodoxin family protein, partial [Alphaproteobacteria bacterium]|nr:flavodoxin family protein [Alphaproteobacteria bacterium]
MLDETQERLCADNTTDFSDLKALTINCTLKPSPEDSHTAKLLGVVEAILVRNRVQLEQVRLVDHAIAPGVYPDMAEQGATRDDWPQIWEKVR